MSPDRTRRRRFPRLDLAEEVRVYDENGTELGTVSQVSGGGMNLEAISLQLAQSLKPGSKLRVSIVEPGSQIRNTVDVVVRSQQGKKLGLEFASSLT